MPKNLLQDMVKIKRKPEVAFRASDLVQKESEAWVSKNQGKGGRSRYALWIVATIPLVFFLFALSYMFLKATVTVNPKMKDVILNKNISASKDGDAGAFPFDLIVISGEENKAVQATGQKDISEKAEGVVVIYNAFSAAPQRLDIDTRLEGSNGKIYKTRKQIIVGGMKGNTPGSIEVGIYAAAGGEEYNSGPLDFTIFGFRGTPKYSKFYARSKGEIAGGFKGKAPVISDTERVNIINNLKIVLQEKLFKKAADQIPDRLILFKDAVFLDTKDSNIELIHLKDNLLSIKFKGTMYGFLFDEEKLTKKIMEGNIGGHDGSPVYLPNIRDLNFSFASVENLADARNINFNLSGTVKIVWKLDEDKLASDLLSKLKKDFNQILLQYPNIDSAQLLIKPFWKRSFPDKIKNIKIIVNYPPRLSF